MGIEWIPEYEVGIAEIDLQHKELLLKIAGLIEAVRLSRGKEEVAATLAFLEGYAAAHFELEQSLMKEHGYSGLAEHLREHEEFVAIFSALAVRLSQEGPSAALAMEVNNKVCNWLVRHVLGTDKPMCDHLRLHGVK